MERERLLQVLGKRELAWIVERARERLSRGEPLAGVIRLHQPSPAQRDELRRLLGKSQLRGDSIAVRLDELDELLANSGICRGLADAVVELVGPIPNQRQAREAAAATWARIFSEQRRRWAGATERPELLRWLETLQKKGILFRIVEGDAAQAETLLGGVSRLLASLPAEQLTRMELAARLFGDAHALDEDQALGRLCVQAAAAWAGRELPSGPEGRREAWEQVGVLSDSLSAPLLVLNLRARPDSLIGQVLQLHADAGEPARLSARALLRQSPRWSTADTGPVVFACENPSVVAAAADRLGSRSAPILCTEGQPRTAVHLLLRALRGAGVNIRYHGDFDWPGIAITNLLCAQHGVAPWRMSTLDYRSAPAGKRLAGAAVEPSWDGELGAAMAERGCAVHEEQVLDLLLDDLRIGLHTYNR